MHDIDAENPPVAVFFRIQLLFTLRINATQPEVLIQALQQVLNVTLRIMAKSLLDEKSQFNLTVNVAH